MVLASTLLAFDARADRCNAGAQAVEPTPDAAAAYELALKMAEEKRHVEALGLFQKAYDLSPSYLILLNVARMAALTGDPARAIRAYDCHVLEGGSEVTPAQRAEIAAEVARLEPEVGFVRVEVDEPGATIEIDGVLIARAPELTPIAVRPGARTIAVRGSKTVLRTLEVAKGATAHAVIEVRPPPPPPPPEPAFRFPGALVGTTWVVTGLVGVSAAVTGALALVGAADLDDDVYLGPSRRPAPGSPIDAKANRTLALATATDVLIALGVITGAAAISFSVVNAVGEEAAPPGRTSARLGVGLGGATIEGSWP